MTAFGEEVSDPPHDDPPKNGQNETVPEAQKPSEEDDDNEPSSSDADAPTGTDEGDETEESEEQPGSSEEDDGNTGMPGQGESGENPPADEPDKEPDDDPEETESEMHLSITNKGVETDAEGIRRIAVRSEKDTVDFKWDGVSGIKTYEFCITDEQGMIICSETTDGRKCSFSVMLFGDEIYTAGVSAVDAEGMITAHDSVRFVLYSEEMPNRPHGFGGLHGFGNFGKTNSDESEEDQGFRIVPGEALTKNHASGTGTVQRFGTVEPTVSQEEMTVLLLGGTQMELSLNGTFRADIDEGTLVLEACGTGSEWRLTQQVLGVLNNSGISELILESSEGRLMLPTDLAFQGYTYGVLRARGYVSKDFAISVIGSEVSVCVADGIYTLSDSFELAEG